jgi:hypothetical protein
MPLLNLNRGSATSVKSRHWLYWATTIPLTLLVLAIYTIYVLVAERRRRDEYEKARTAGPKDKPDRPSPSGSHISERDSARKPPVDPSAAVPEPLRRRLHRRDTGSIELGLPDRIATI